MWRDQNPRRGRSPDRSGRLALARSPPIGLWSSGSASSLPDTSLIAQLSTPMTPDPQWMTSNIILRLGKKAHLVQYPLRSGSIINLVATIGSASPTGGADHSDRENGRRSEPFRSRTRVLGVVERGAPADKGAGSVARLAALSPSSHFFIFTRARGACRRRGSPNGAVPCTGSRPSH